MSRRSGRWVSLGPAAWGRGSPSGRGPVGLRGRAVDVDDATCARAASALAKVLERLVAKGKYDRGEQKKEVLARICFSRRSASPRSRASRFSSRRSSSNVDVKKAIFAKLERDLRRRGGVCYLHLFPFDHRDGLPRQVTREVRRHALLQPGSGDEAGRGDPRPADRSRKRPTWRWRWRRSSARPPSPARTPRVPVGEPAPDPRHARSRRRRS